jgi:YD repeat-containing protein
MTDLTYPDTRHLKQAWDGAGRLGVVQDATSGQQYVESISYYPHGTPNMTTLGNGIQQTVLENNRLQV